MIPSIYIIFFHSLGNKVMEIIDYETGFSDFPL